MYRCPICGTGWKNGDDHNGCPHFRGYVPFEERRRMGPKGFYVRLADMMAFEAQRLARHGPAYWMGEELVMDWYDYIEILRSVPGAL
jgi:hypothetical protein